MRSFYDYWTHPINKKIGLAPVDDRKGTTVGVMAAKVELLVRRPPYGAPIPYIQAPPQESRRKNLICFKFHSPGHYTNEYPGENRPQGNYYRGAQQNSIGPTNGGPSFSAPPLNAAAAVEFHHYLAAVAKRGLLQYTYKKGSEWVRTLRLHCFGCVRHLLAESLKA